MRTRSEASVSSLAAARRRASPPSEEHQLRRILDAHDEIVGAGLDIHRLVDVITHHAAELTHSSGAVLEVIEGDELVYWSASGSVIPFLGLRVHADRSLSGLAAKSNRVLACDDTETDPRVDREACRRLGVRSMLTAPLPYRGVNIGVLKVDSPWRKAYSGDDVEVLERLNTLIGAALAHAAEHALLAEQQLVARAVEEDDKASMAHHLEQIIETRKFQVAYQPIIDLQRSELVGHEALVRFPTSKAQWSDLK
jgi:GAF domain-containing protein